ncbi:MAG: hypothetical protein ACK6DN_07950 [Planctomycetota bacterium]|jgi:hypothetical protein
MPIHRAYILCNFARFSRLYTSWLDRLPVPWEIVEGVAADWEPPADAGIVITHMHYRWEEVRAIRRVTEQNRIPVLILADGILEYRNLYEHPDLADGCIFQPVMGHKLACIGRAQARVVESWGNVGKCEVVGLPRLDSLLTDPAPPIRTEGPFRLLIATATTPFFNAQQREAVVESLLHFKQRLEANGRVNGRRMEVTWRLTGGLERDLGLEKDSESVVRPPLSEAIDRADAVITTPSTLYLESVLKQRPTAILDFYNSPNFVSAAWTINAPRHFNAILSELANPPAAKMLFQETELHDQLACQSPATPRMIELTLALMRAREDSLRSGELLQLPRRMLADPLQGFAPVEPRFDLAQLFPGNEVFGESELERVQVELNLARERLGSLPGEMEELRQRTLELNEQNQKLNGRAREQRQRFEKLRATYLQLKERWQQRRKPSGPGSVSPRSGLGMKSKEGVNLRIEPDEAAGAHAGQLPESGPREAVVEASRPIAELDSPLPESAVPASGST